MTIIAPTFDFMKVSPANDALLYNGLSSGDKVIKGYKNEFTCSASGLTATINPGAAIIQGRLFVVDTVEQVNVPSNSNGYICLTVDLSKTNTFTGVPGEDNYKPVNNQVRIEFVRSLVQQDLHTSGKIYNLPIAKVTSTSTLTISRFLPDIVTPVFQNGFKNYGASPITVYRDGNMVTLTGQFTNTNKIAAGAGITIATIPKEYAPTSMTAISLAQASGGSIFLLSVSSEGNIGMERHRSGSGSYTDCPIGSWLVADMTWSVR